MTATQPAGQDSQKATGRASDPASPADQPTASGTTRAPFGLAYVAPVRAGRLIDSAKDTAEAENRHTAKGG